MNAITISLVGNPNCGKTTLFNALTGSRQRVGNWPGVTVERKSGFFKHQNTTIEVVDLPGTYSLTTVSEASIDERIACEYILNRRADVIVNIIDASNLERHLYLTTQLIEMRVPMIVALNMMDVAQQRQMKILLDTLQKRLGCSVVALEAHKGKGIKELKQKIAEIAKAQQPNETIIPYPKLITETIENLAKKITKTHSNISNTWLSMRLLEEDLFARSLVQSIAAEYISSCQKRICETLGEDTDILLADARYRFIHTLVAECLLKDQMHTSTWTARIDQVVLNRILGIPLFLFMMYFMFLFAINIGGAFQGFFDIAGNTIFVDGLAYGLAHMGTPHWLIALLANGIGKGITTVLTFIPVIGALFLFLTLLEDSGYMTRAAFVVDRLMRAMGLPGKSFVPMIVGFGCNVPAVMATRTLDNKRDRILTVMMAPFMSCGARLAIYAVFIAAFFPTGGQNIVFALYLIGIGMAMLTGVMLRNTVLKGDPAPLIMELPPYHVPRVKTLLLHTWQRLKSFVFRAGKLIVPICVLIGLLNTLNLHGVLNSNAGDAGSLLSILGRWVTPIFSPMGISAENWPATVGLVTGILAKEVVVGTLNTLYSQVGHLSTLPAEAFNFWGGLHDALLSIPASLGELGHALGNPVLAKAPVHTLNQDVYGVMYQHFDGQVGAMAYLLFVLLYFPCVSTMAVMLRELNRGWTLFSALWTTGIAYCVAVAFYQTATLMRHPISSLLWLGGIIMVVGMTVMGIKMLTVSPLKQQSRAMA